MEERKEFIGNSRSAERDEVFSKSVRAGKRTYFFDVKTTRKDEYYLTITESKKRFNKEGRHFYEKHKIFLYKEDFNKFQEGLQEVLGFIRSSENASLAKEEPIAENKKSASADYTNVEFEDLEVGVAEEEINQK